MNNKLKLLAILALSLSLFACNGKTSEKQASKSQQVVAEAVTDQTTVTENPNGTVTEQNTVAEATQEKNGEVNVQGVTQDETFKEPVSKTVDVPKTEAPEKAEETTTTK
ncbi:hypothetical protein [uncultured Cetobacterium sp.]|uniref:hypothetical protein n=1 Tax=uncultured Cetobacterium sp. TaxID=527638 RepID=UPI0026125334|nr:hypothetical protein [uncultured Cetobacterium sp.]